MFKSATLRLTLAYLGIIMAISLFFSTILYRSAVRELQRPPRATQDIGMHILPNYGEFERVYGEQLAESRRRVMFDLVQINIVIMVLAGAGSYWLAKQTLAPIEEALDAQSRFSADASHELRTPLAAMQSEIEVTLRDKDAKLSAAAKAVLQSNLEEVAKLRALADGLLTLSRQQTRQQLDLVTVSMLAATDEARERLAPVVAASGAKVEVKGNNQKLLGDHESLVRLMTILIDNAIKYSRDKPVINIRLGRQLRTVIVTVSDHGIGIKASDLPHIFDRFYRADTSRSKKLTEGYGLGLSIAKQIVELHQGSIEAISTPDKGTKFVIKLPTRPAQNFLTG